MSQNQVNKIQCLNYVYTYTTYECSRVYMCVSPANYNGIIEKHKVHLSLTFFHEISFSKQNRLVLNETNHNHFQKSYNQYTTLTLLHFLEKNKFRKNRRSWTIFKS
jgi:hypothetical protein